MKTPPRPGGNEDVHDVDPSDHPVAHQVLQAQTVLKLSTVFIYHQPPNKSYFQYFVFSESRANFFCVENFVGQLVVVRGDFGEQLQLEAGSLAN